MILPSRRVFILCMTWGSALSFLTTGRRAFVGTQTTSLRLSAVQQDEKKSNQWDEDHLIHGAGQIHEDTEEELRESEDFAAWDAHDCNDPGMEAVMEECAIMMANKYAHDLKQKQKEDKGVEQSKEENAWNKDHLAHGIDQLHEETDDELVESEDSAAWDAHDSSDAGLEAAAEERAVMMANELMHKMKEKAPKRSEENK